MTRHAARQAMEWLGAQLGDLSTIRNATARDQSFKNWRQSTLTILQRIWPADQDRIERFRRIPFSPADPRADVRTTREWYSRGCQEAARVLTQLIEDVRTNGVAEAAATELSELQVGEFDNGFPTVDLPGGEATAVTPPPAAPAGQSPAVPTGHGAEQLTPTFAKIGTNMKTRLRELLGFAQLSAKALTGAPAGETPAPESTPAPKANSVPRAGTWNASAPAADGASSNLLRAMRAKTAPPTSVPLASPYVPPPAEAAATGEPLELPSGASVSMSKPTTLRGSIEKVTIESLISPTFRGEGEPAPDDADEDSADGFRDDTALEALTESDATPQELDPEPPRPAGRPALTLVRAVPDPPAVPPRAEPAASATPPVTPEPPRGARSLDESALEDPDAIAVVSMAQDLARLGVPAERQAEARARLADLARRIERGQIEWGVLRKAVWFAMEYPEVARRLLPVLLPWIERAA